MARFTFALLAALVAVTAAAPVENTQELAKRSSGQATWYASLSPALQTLG